MSVTRRQLLAGGLLAGLFGGRSQAQTSATEWYNWSGALSCVPAGRFRPGSEGELMRFLSSTSGPVRPVGSGHSFSPLVPTDGHIVVIDQLAGLIRHDARAMQATFGAGTRLSDLGAPLEALGQAMFNMPDIDRQTFAGAVATATHGTGVSLGCISDYVTHMRLVTPTGDVLNLSAEENADVFQAARVNLGALGIVTEITTRNRETYRLKAVTEVMPLADALAGFDANARRYRHYEMFPIPYSTYTLTLAIEETDEATVYPDGAGDDEETFLSLVELLMAGPAFLRGPVIDMLFGETPSSTVVDVSYKALTNVRNSRFNEMEYSVPVGHGHECLMEVLDTIKDQGIDVIFPLEYRWVKGDDTWLGMSTGGEAHAAISVHQIASHDYRPLFDAVEPIFWKYEGRPHWGKLHTLGAAELRALYPRFDDFNAVRAELDPSGRMLNPHLGKLFGVEV